MLLLIACALGFALWRLSPTFLARRYVRLIDRYPSHNRISHVPKHTERCDPLCGCRGRDV